MDLILLSIGPKKFKFYEMMLNTITHEQTESYQNLLEQCRNKLSKCSFIGDNERQELVYHRLDSVRPLLLRASNKVFEEGKEDQKTTGRDQTTTDP